MADDPKLSALAERIVYLKTWSKTVRRIIQALPDWVTPNRVTLLRAALTAPIAWALSSGRYWTGLALFILAMVLDAVDGAIAHIKNMSTTSGAFLDPLADKLIVGGAIIAVWDLLPGWILLMAGGGMIFAAAITLQRIWKLLRSRGLRGPELSATVAAKPAGKVKTIFDIMAAATVIVGLATGSRTVINAGGALIVVGSVLAGCIHFFLDGRANGVRPAGLHETARVPRMAA